MKIETILLIITCLYYILESLLFGLLEVFTFNDILDSLYTSDIYAFINTLMNVIFHSALIAWVYKTRKFSI